LDGAINIPLLTINEDRMREYSAICGYQERRGQGVGLALLRHILSQNKGKRIDVFVVRNNEARIFYERFGFKEQTEWCLYRIGADE
jgi:GNAT superfamily N-acetyltransferase